jgi:hypothetical protein
MPPLLDLAGQKIGRWTVIEQCGRQGTKILWRCRCECGAIGHVTSGNLVHGTSRQCRRCGDIAKAAKPPRNCDLCGVKYSPRTSRSKYCSDICRGRAQWHRIAASAHRKAAHSKRVTAASKAERAVDHPACAWCCRPFRDAPSRKHCSQECLDAVIRSGRYRNAHHRRRVLAEMAALATEMQRRFDETE